MSSRTQSDPQLGTQDLNIHRAKQLCFQRIHDCGAQQDPRFSAHVQGLEQMLQLWAKHSGVDARKGMSLDDRLKDHPDLKESLIGLLELIEQKITQALSSPDDSGNAANPPATMSIDNDGVDLEKFLIKQKWRSYSGNPWETAGAAVDMLIEFTAMIRRSTVRNSTLPTHFHRPDDYFAEYAKLLARNWFKDARRSLTDQLGDSVFVRRRQMLYKLKHEEKIMYPGTHLTPPPVEPAPDSLPTREATPEMEPQKQTTPRIKSLGPVVPIFANPSPSSTNLSRIDRTRLKQHGRRFGALSGITEGSLSIEEAGFLYMYPEPPTLGEKQRYGVCPYCSRFLPSSKLTKESWRKHLHEDLQPYACISEKCQDTLRFFSNSQQWLQHMDEFHGNDWPQKVHMKTWYCDREHDRLEFKSEFELHGHLIHDHASLSEAHVSALVRRNWGVGCREAHVCPLCESTPRNIVPLMNDKDKASLLFRHIGDHLKALALFSLPSLSTDPANDEQKSSSGAQLPTNDASKADPSGNNQIVAQVDEDLEGSLNFNDDPHSFMDAAGSKTIIDEEHATNVPSDLDTNLEWKFASSEHEALEHDPVLQNLRKHGESQQMNSSEEPHRRADLYVQIFISSILSVFDDTKRYFLPNGAIDNLVTKDSVHRELWAEPSSLAQDKVESLVEFVLASAKKLFATTIMLGHSHQFLQNLMQWFQDKDITDDSLPLEVSWWEENCWYETLEERIAPVDATYNDSRSSSINKDLWPLSVVENFCFKQQMFLVPIFSDTGLSYDLEPGTILPFTERDTGLSYDLEPGTILPFTERDTEVDDRGVKGITKYRIHERHMDQPTMDADRPYYVAVRQVRLTAHHENTTLGWKIETNTLRSLNSLGHEHIVRFLSAFRRGQEDDVYLMFEWANGGNLPNLWYTFHRPELTSGLVKAAFRQMGGLADAIDSVYSTFGSLYPRHGDLKPENIFWFKSHDEDGFGTLRIGVWAVEDQVQEYGEAKRYEAPELHTGRRSSGDRPHLSDIWSMGCIMLECLIWLMYGVDMLEKFSTASKSWVLSQGTFFYEGEEDGSPIVTVDPVVSEWMDHMEDDPACEVGTTALGNLLQVIRTRLLVVELPREPELDWNTPSLSGPADSHSPIADQAHQEWGRCTPSELEKRMREILDENETEEYWLAANPKSPPEEI